MAGGKRENRHTSALEQTKAVFLSRQLSLKRYSTLLNL